MHLRRAVHGGPHSHASGAAGSGCVGRAHPVLGSHRCRVDHCAQARSLPHTCLCSHASLVLCVCVTTAPYDRKSPVSSLPVKRQWHVRDGIVPSDPSDSDGPCPNAQMLLSAAWRPCLSLGMTGLCPDLSSSGGQAAGANWRSAGNAPAASTDRAGCAAGKHQQRS